MKEKMIMYFHSGSKNHGCEALVRSTQKLLQMYKFDLYSFKPQEDIHYGISEIVNVKSDKKEINTKSLEYLIYKMKYKITKNDKLYYELQHKHIYKKLDGITYALSIGGDNYCYEGLPERLAEYNTNFNKKNIKTILWGCSIEPELLKNNDIINDLKTYSLIYARESITYNALCEYDLKNKTVLFPDPAFALEKEEVVLPNNFIDGNTVGINISPLVKKSALDDEIILNNYCELIEFILNETDMNIALIPHVIWEDSDDREILIDLYNKYKNSKRIVLLADDNCMKLKGYISHCRFFIGARTHSTIAAYSSLVPTLVVGYSVKAKGIAQDLFGDYNNFVLAAQSLKHSNELTEAFKFLMKNEMHIKHILKLKMNEYIKKLENIDVIFREK